MGISMHICNYDLQDSKIHTIKQLMTMPNTHLLNYNYSGYSEHKHQSLMKLMQY